MAEQWLSIVEYARTFAVSDMTVRRRIKNGKLQAVLKEGKYYIPIGTTQVMTDTPSIQDSHSLGNQTDSAVANQTSFRNAAFSRAENSAIKAGASYRTLPTNFTSPGSGNEQATVNAQALLNYCEQSVTRINSIEKHLQESYQLRIQSLESQIHMKDQKISQLMQQVEDLQMLVKLMEISPKT